MLYHTGRVGTYELLVMTFLTKRRFHEARWWYLARHSLMHRIYWLISLPMAIRLSDAGNTAVPGAVGAELPAADRCVCTNAQYLTWQLALSELPASV
jgi:hypothetical protein